MRSAQKTRTQVPDRHCPPPRPTSRISEPPFTHGPASSSRSHTHTTHCRPQSHVHDARPHPATGAVPNAALSAPLQDLSPVTAAAPPRFSPQELPDSLVPGLQAVAGSGRALPVQGPLGNVVPESGGSFLKSGEEAVRRGSSPRPGDHCPLLEPPGLEQSRLEAFQPRLRFPEGPAASVNRAESRRLLGAVSRLGLRRCSCQAQRDL